MAEERILAPFPDELVTARGKMAAIVFLIELGAPFRISASHLTRWGEVTDVTVTPDDVASLRIGLQRGR